MTPAERALWRAVERHARAIGPEMRAALLRLFREVNAHLTDADLTRLLASGQVEQIVAEVVRAFESERAVAPVREAIRTAYRSSAVAGIRVLPFPRAFVLEVSFDYLNPRVIDAIRGLESRALSTITADAAATVRQVVQQGIETGLGPRALIPRLRNSIGLAPNQQAAVDNFRAALESGDFAKARGYALRDRRFDGSLKRGATLTRGQVDRMAGQYEQGMRAFHAETHARTAALDATRAGQRASWDAAIESGGLDRGRMRKRWVTTIDGRQRPEHEAANGIEVPFDALFPVDGGVMTPGINSFNCRCYAAYRYAPARRP